MRNQCSTSATSVIPSSNPRRIVDLVTILPLLLIGVVFYLLVLRPQKARQKAQAAMIAAVAPGSSVMTTAGVFGTVVASNADEVSLEIAPGVVIRMLPAAIAKVIPVEEPDADSAAVNLEKPAPDESAQ
ncbi:MAG: preprotein translocase subunit YajC [Actinobacteria bacterium]|nr:preprotein translocase subunit YajC [Actinomycetota bacterium]